VYVRTASKKSLDDLNDELMGFSALFIVVNILFYMSHPDYCVVPFRHASRDKQFVRREMGSEFSSLFDGVRRYVFHHSGRGTRMESPRPGATTSTPGKTTSVRFAPPSPGNGSGSGGDGGLAANLHHGSKGMRVDEHFLRVISGLVQSVFK